MHDAVASDVRDCGKSAAIAGLGSLCLGTRSSEATMGTPATIPDHDDGWLIAPPAAVGIHADVLSGLAPRFENGCDANLHATLMFPEGRLVY